MSRPVALTPNEVSWLKILIEHVDPLVSLDAPFSPSPDRPMIVTPTERTHIRNALTNLAGLISDLG